MKGHFTKQFIESLTIPEGEAQLVVWDDEQPGLGIVIGKLRRTFVANAYVNGKRRRVVLGHYGKMNVPQARAEARKKLGEMHDGIDRNEAARAVKKGITFKEARSVHIDKMIADDGSPDSRHFLKYETDLHLADWLDRPLALITRTECRERHKKLTENSGTYSANRVMRHLRAVYNTALKEHELPANPTIAVHWNKEYRRQEPVPWTKLPEYVEIIKSLPPVKRDYYLILLLTGLRRTDCATIRWDDLNEEAKVLHRPNPKGGELRAFYLPLSEEAMRILLRRMELNGGKDGGWVFPTTPKNCRPCRWCEELELPPHERGKPVHLIETRALQWEKNEEVEVVDEATRRKAYRRKLILPSPHRWRDTYTTALAEADIDPYTIDVLTNHRPPSGSVTAGYINISEEHKAACQERVTQFILSKVGRTTFAD